MVIKSHSIQFQKQWTFQKLLKLELYKLISSFTPGCSAKSNNHIFNMGKSRWCYGQWGKCDSMLQYLWYGGIVCFNSILCSVRFKTVWIYWCGCNFRSASWVIICHWNGLVGTMYASTIYFWKLDFAMNLPILYSHINFQFFYLSYFASRLARSTAICFPYDGICCPIIQKDQQRFIYSFRRTTSSQVLMFINHYFMLHL